MTPSSFVDGVIPVSREGQELRGRRGRVFSVRFTDAERSAIENAVAVGHGPRTVGAWVRHQALTAAVIPELHDVGVLPVRSHGGNAQPAESGSVVSGPDNTRAGIGNAQPAAAQRVILDLCAGSGSWSAPYAADGYDVRKITLPESDVRVLPSSVLPARVWGVLAAPPCNQFSLARNGHEKRSPRDLVRGMEVVNACLRIILQVKPKWWALENPCGMLSRFLGTPRDVWNPCDFGDPWTKRTAIWGEFVIPARGPFVRPQGSGPICKSCRPGKAPNLYCRNVDHRAMTPSGFARAFREANP